ncbi:MAG TPA: mannose-1-phosphate guanyltransferase [Anaerolinea thermolimosa]|uniref:mannose-1-phosphate guanylyltransferase n=2 Tax=Anaerolinea thermolimosa TaxID=229919 RepID=A0A3D1JCW1_9CHLR|nr:mannose-1-phosphate guanyltransferase [Anaerolinea thermolimosa]
MGGDGMDDNHFYAVIMAGGSGTRLWPFSRRDRPKQMLRLGSDQTLFQQAVNRLLGVIPLERILVVTVASQAEALHAQFPLIPPENFLIEPAPRGTAAVVGMAAVALRHRDPESTMVVVTADHLIRNQDYFRQLLRGAYDVAQQGFLVTLGIQPTYPSSGYGYIECGEPLGMFQGCLAYRAVRFLEKPSPERAAELVRQGNYVWNSGMFIWKTERIWEEFHRLMPELAQTLDEIDRSWKPQPYPTVAQETWLSIHQQTIDYGIMERADQVAVLPAHELGWNDVGAWDSLYDVFEENEAGNIVVSANHIGLDTHGTLVVAEKPERLIVTIGASDLMVIETGDVLLICQRHQAQKVRDVVELLKNGGNTQAPGGETPGVDTERYL